MPIVVGVRGGDMRVGPCDRKDSEVGLGSTGGCPLSGHSTPKPRSTAARERLCRARLVHQAMKACVPTCSKTQIPQTANQAIRFSFDGRSTVRSGRPTILVAAQTRVMKVSKAATELVATDIPRKRQHKARDHPVDSLFNFGI